jgi:hypothetical protein
MKDFFWRARQGRPHPPLPPPILGVQRLFFGIGARLPAMRPPAPGRVASHLAYRVRARGILDPSLGRRVRHRSLLARRPSVVALYSRNLGMPQRGFPPHAGSFPSSPRIHARAPALLHGAAARVITGRRARVTSAASRRFKCGGPPACDTCGPSSTGVSCPREVDDGQVGRER